MAATQASVADRVIRLAECGSTNTEAMRHGLSGDPGPLWIVADVQYGGRGRSGRTWVSPPGNFSGSVLVTLTCDASALPQLSLVAGVAVLDALRQTYHEQGKSKLCLKWPNDVLLDGRKVGGLLVESSRSTKGALIAVVGIGLNLASAPDGQPGAGTLTSLGLLARPDTVLSALAPSFTRWIGTWGQGVGFGAIREAWCERAITIGERLSVHAGERRVAGRYRGIDLDGGLLIEDDQYNILKFAFGDVALA